MALLDNLQGYWSFDEASGNALDSSGNGYTLTETGGTIARVTPLISVGSAADFEKGDTEWFQRTDPNFSEGANMTWNIWLKPESLAEDDTIFAKRVTATDDRSFRMIVLATTSEFQFNISSNGTSLGEGAVTSALGSLVATESHMYTITFDGSQSLGSRTKIYKDGVLTTPIADTTPATCFNSTADFFVGAGNAGALPWDGIMDEFGIWNRTLSQTEITQLYNAGSGLPYPFTLPTSIKTVDGLVKASTKTVNGLAIASVSSINGLT